MAELGVRVAHIDGGVPNIRIVLPKLDAYYIGQLFYFFEKAVGISGYMLEVNPFNQPGVEAYKKNMFALLEKPGFEAETEARLKGSSEVTLLTAWNITINCPPSFSPSMAAISKIW